MATATIAPATDKQLAFLQRLAQERSVIVDTTGMSKREASDEINRLLDMPRPLPQPKAMAGPAADVPAGRFAVEIGGHLHFFQVDRPASGKWAGWTFVKRQSGGNFDRLPRGEAQEVLELIAADADEALRRYGRELGVCGVCGRELTDDESRAKGIGPTCEARR